METPTETPVTAQPTDADGKLITTPHTEKFKCGDLVSLKSGGPVMTLVRYLPDNLLQVECCHYEEGNERMYGVFNGAVFWEAMLDRVDIDNNVIPE